MLREDLTPAGATRRRLAAAIALALSGCASPLKPPPTAVATANPPPAPREFRAVWVATVDNIDWPSKPGLPVAQQQEELRRIVSVSREMGLNALVVQVRPAMDALYASALEPWSEYLTGAQGRAPEPFYDPLALWIEEAHRNGLELHAWFNPYRARHPSAKGALAANHISNTRPALSKKYGESLWLDPGEPESAQHTLAVVLDIVRRYDVDGVHLDDYFYPYPVKVPGTAEDRPEVDFPDESSWQAYLAKGGTLARADWRRQNVNALIEALHAGIHREKPWVRFGISPFGIGRPDRRPPGIAGFSQYDKLYADVELWLARGWLDYLAPQLYWPIAQAPQAFAPLLAYWQRENTHGRHIWPGLFTSRINDTPKTWLPAEIVDQVALGRTRGATGHIHFSMAALRDNRKGVTDQLAAASYSQQALAPSTPWLSKGLPPRPVASLAADGAGSVELRITGGAWLHAVWARYGADWRFSAIPGGGTRLPARFGNRALEAVVVSAVDRLGVESERVSVALP